MLSCCHQETWNAGREMVNCWLSFARFKLLFLAADPGKIYINNMRQQIRSQGIPDVASSSTNIFIVLVLRKLTICQYNLQKYASIYNTKLAIQIMCTYVYSKICIWFIWSLPCLWLWRTYPTYPSHLPGAWPAWPATRLRSVASSPQVWILQVACAQTVWPKELQCWMMDRPTWPNPGYG